MTPLEAIGWRRADGELPTRFWEPSKWRWHLLFAIVFIAVWVALSYAF